MIPPFCFFGEPVPRGKNPNWGIQTCCVVFVLKDKRLQLVWLLSGPALNQNQYESNAVCERERMRVFCHSFAIFATLQH